MRSITEEWQKIWAGSNPTKYQLQQLSSGQEDLRFTTLNQNQEIALHVACHRGDAASVRFLLEYEPEQQVLCRTAFGYMAIHIACRRNAFECVSLLLEHVPELQVAPLGPQVRPLFYACAFKATESVKLLLRHVPEEQVMVKSLHSSWDKSGCGQLRNMIPLHVAALRSAHQCVRLLLEHHPVQQVLERIQVIDCRFVHRPFRKYPPEDTKERAINIACKRGDRESVKMLLEHAPEEQFKINGRWRIEPLRDACEADEAQDLKLLLDHISCLLLGEAKSNRSLLFNACNGQTECLKVLFDYLPVDEVMKRDREGRIPLHVACQNGSMSSVQLLLEHGGFHQVLAQVDCPRKPGYYKLPIHYACERYFEIVQLLLTEYTWEQLSFCGPRGPLLHHACHLNSPILAKLLLTYSRKILALWDEQGKLPIHVACAGSFTCVLALLQFFPEEQVNQRTKYGSWPIHIACGSGECGTLRILLQYFPEKQVLKRDRDGRLPIFFSRCSEAIILLLEHEPEQQIRRHRLNISGPGLVFDKMVDLFAWGELPEELLDRVVTSDYKEIMLQRIISRLAKSARSVME